MKKIILGLLVMCGCQNQKIIEPGDTVVKCVIDSFSVIQPVSVMDVSPKYYYFTDCGTRIIVNNNHFYKIGDTITYVYKKEK